MTKEEIKSLNVFQRLSAITSEMKTIEKKSDVATSKDKSYKAVREIDILNAVKPLEEKYGIYSYPFDRQVIESKQVQGYSEKQNNFLRVEVTYRFVNVDMPSEFIEVKSYGDGIDSQDKAPGKALTYADKYALLKAYKIATGDDPDENTKSDEELQQEEEQVKAKQNAKFQKTVTKLFNDFVTKVGDKSLVYVQIGMSKEDFILQYNSDPKQLATLLEKELSKYAK